MTHDVVIPKTPVQTAPAFCIVDNEHIKRSQATLDRLSQSSHPPITAYSWSIDPRSQRSLLHPSFFLLTPNHIYLLCIFCYPAATDSVAPASRAIRSTPPLRGVYFSAPHAPSSILPSHFTLGKHTQIPSISYCTAARHRIGLSQVPLTCSSRSSHPPAAVSSWTYITPLPALHPSFPHPHRHSNLPHPFYIPCTSVRNIDSAFRNTLRYRQGASGCGSKSRKSHHMCLRQPCIGNTHTSTSPTRPPQASRTSCCISSTWSSDTFEFPAPSEVRVSSGKSFLSHATLIEP